MHCCAVSPSLAYCCQLSTSAGAALASRSSNSNLSSMYPLSQTIWAAFSNARRCSVVSMTVSFLRRVPSIEPIHRLVRADFVRVVGVGHAFVKGVIALYPFIGALVTHDRLLSQRPNMQR